MSRPLRVFSWYPMSAQPPHHGAASFLRMAQSPSAFRHIKTLIVVSCVVLAGCATQGESYQLAGPDEIDSPSLLVGDRSSRSQALAYVRPDPLGAYLSAQQRVSRAEPAGLASTALTYLGIKYRFGGDTP